MPSSAEIPKSDDSQSFMSRRKALGLFGVGIFGAVLCPSAVSAAPAGSVAVRAARRQIGLPYRLGHALPGKAFDCSGLTMWAWQQAGVSMQHLTDLQASSFREISPKDLQPGDLVFTQRLDHVVLYSGNGMCIQAARPGTNVFESPLIFRNLCVRPTLSPVRKAPFAIKSGQRHIVGGGETLFAIASARKIPLLSFARLNGLSPSSRLLPGDVLALPVKAVPLRQTVKRKTTRR
jgi:hypothetical protein